MDAFIWAGGIVVSLLAIAAIGTFLSKYGGSILELIFRLVLFCIGLAVAGGGGTLIIYGPKWGGAVGGGAIVGGLFLIGLGTVLAWCSIAQRLGSYV